MPSPRDITEALSNWENRQVDATTTAMYRKSSKNKLPERKLNPDLFSIWVYSMLMIALLAQLGTLVSIDLLDLF